MASAEGPTPFSYYSVYYHPAETWTYVLKTMTLTRWQRHRLLSGIADSRRVQHGRIDEAKTRRVLHDVLAGEYDH